MPTFPKPLTPLSLPRAAWLRLRGGQTKGPGGVAPELEKLQRGSGLPKFRPTHLPPSHRGQRATKLPMTLPVSWLPCAVHSVHPHV